MSYYANSSPGTELPRELRDALGQELWKDEQLLWTGQPGRSPGNRGSEWGAFLFGIPWTAFSVFWTVMAFAGTQGSTNTPLAFKIFFPLFGLPFVAIGVGLLASPFLAGKKQSKIIYAITDQRVILMSLAGHREVKSYTPRDPNYYQSVTRADGSGDLTFAPNYQNSAAIAYGNMASPLSAPVLYGIPNVRQVESLLRETFVDGRHIEKEGATTGVGKAPGYFATRP